MSNQEENYQGIVFQTRVVPLRVSFLALRSVSVGRPAFLQPWYPAGWRGRSRASAARRQRAGMLDGWL